MKKNDLIVVLDKWDNVVEYTTITRINQNTITVGYTKYDKKTLKSKHNYSIELFNKDKHGDGYKYDLILSYKEEVKDMLEELNNLVETAKQYNSYIELNWVDYEEDLRCLFDRLKEDFLGVIE